MEKTPILAIMYDFDHTLSPRDMQEYGFIPDLGMEADVFWNKCLKAMKRNQMDQILAYMYMMLEEAKGKLIVNRNMLRALGKDVQLFDGVSDWFARVNEYARSRGLQPEHYIISSGLKEIIEGTPIAKEFKEIYAASFCYDEHGVACWPAMAVNYTSKTQFLFRVNKGVLDVTEHRALNEFMPEEKRRVPFSNMIYVGDGLTDVPSMKLTKLNGGHSIAVWQLYINHTFLREQAKQTVVDMTIDASMRKMALAQKYQSILAEMEQVDYEDYSIGGTEYEKLLTQHTCELDETTWDRVPFGSITVDH